MFKMIKNSYQSNLANQKKLNALTTTGISMFYASVSLAMWIMVAVALDVIVYSSRIDGGFISLWLSYILIAAAATLALDYGKNNWAFLVSLSVPLVQLISGYYDYWFGIFNISWDEIFLDFQVGYTSLDVFMLYLANGAYLLGLVALILGRPELRRLFSALWKKA
jgi:hypothetical protein